MRRTFTFLEVIIVLVVIGILAAIAIPKISTNRLLEATNKLLYTIRYTQHLALVDEKFVPNITMSSYSNSTQKVKDVKFWFKKWWILYIRDINGNHPTAIDDMPGPDIVVFSDKPSSNNNNKYNRNPSKAEIARDPLSGRLMCGHKYDNSFNDEDIDRNFNLSTYGIKRVIISSPCSSKNKITFDELGRPYCVIGATSGVSQPYNYLLQNTHKITLCTNASCEENMSVCIEPISGYIHICN